MTVDGGSFESLEALQATVSEGWKIKAGPCDDEISLFFPFPEPLHLADDRLASRTAMDMSEGLRNIAPGQPRCVGTEFRDDLDDSHRRSYWFKLTFGEPVPKSFQPAINEASKLLTKAWAKSI